MKSDDFIEIAASKSHAPGGGHPGRFHGGQGGHAACMLRDLLDERARLFTKAEELKVLNMARVKEKMG